MNREYWAYVLIGVVGFGVLMISLSCFLINAKLGFFVLGLISILASLILGAYLDKWFIE